VLIAQAIFILDCEHRRTHTHTQMPLPHAHWTVSYIIRDS